ncbi:SGNH/GDSL hydrolase family protein [Nonomuraea dietziae]|uniref:SGNH/GDSL hydrolase family protein n=1 Tax=Nonomuraea dietziae TaxID=65515 RepID=UPI0031D3E763
MAALGDSVSAGFNACGWYVSCTSRSWSAGDNAEVRSHYVRLAERGPSLRGHNRNFAVPGATSADLMGQVDKAIAEKAEYVTILLGAQDACVPTEAAMTPVALFRRRVEAAMGRLRAELPGGAGVRGEHPRPAQAVAGGQGQRDREDVLGAGAHLPGDAGQPDLDQAGRCAAAGPGA